jgi:hypothetical protein
VQLGLRNVQHSSTQLIYAVFDCPLLTCKRALQFQHLHKLLCNALSASNLSCSMQACQANVQLLSNFSSMACQILLQISEVESRGVTGSELISLMNTDSLGDIYLTSKLKIQQMRWNLERRCERGDDGAKNAIGQHIRAGSGDIAAPIIDHTVTEHSLPRPPKRASTKKKKVIINLIDFGDDAEDDDTNETGDDSDNNDDDNDVEEQPPIDMTGPVPTALVYEVRFERDEPPNVLLQEHQPGNRLVVKSFPKRADGTTGAAEASGKIEKGDFVTAVNGVNLDGFPFQDAIRLLTERHRPLVLRFMRVPRHLVRHNVEQWSMHALRTVLHEQGIELTGLERHKELVAMATRAFWERPVPLPPAAPKV